MDEDAPGAPAPSATSDDSPFELSLRSCIDELFEKAEKAQTDPTFANATDACLATRVAWGVYFSEWQAAGGCAPDLTERLRAGLSLCKEAVKVVARDSSVTDDERDMTGKFAHSIGFRMTMCDLLFTEGPAAVITAAHQENEKRKRQEARQSSGASLANLGA